MKRDDTSSKPPPPVVSDASRRGTLVTVGSGTRYPFARLVDAVRDALPLLPAPVTIQHGCMSVEVPEGATGVRMLSHSAFSERLSGARLLVSHAGAGTVMEALRAGIPAFVMPRRPELGEVADGHQLEFALAMARCGLVRTFEDASGLRALLSTGDALHTGPRSDLGQPELCAAVGARVRVLMARSGRAKLLLAATAGGHMTELRQLRDGYAAHPHVYVTTREPVEDDPATSRHVFPSTDRDWHVLLHVRGLARMLLRERPGVVLSTGSGSVIPLILIARLLGARIVYVESITRVLRPSITARVVYPFCDVFIVRWPEIARRFGRATLVPATGHVRAARSLPETSVEWPMRLDP